MRSCLLQEPSRAQSYGKEAVVGISHPEAEIDNIPTLRESGGLPDLSSMTSHITLILTA